MTSAWKPYTLAQVDQLARASGSPLDGRERVCPVCAQRSVRLYYYEHTGGNRTVGFSYVWCANCHHYRSDSGEPLSTQFQFTDPMGSLTREQRNQLEDDLFAWYEHLDAQWDAGQLPQVFAERS